MQLFGPMSTDAIINDRIKHRKSKQKLSRKGTWLTIVYMPKETPVIQVIQFLFHPS